MSETAEQLIWLLRVYFWVLKSLVGIAFDTLNISVDPEIVTAGVIVVFVLSMTATIKFVFGNIGNIFRLVGLALYVLVLTMAYNKLLSGG